MISNRQISFLRRRLTKVPWTKDSTENHRLAIAFVKDTLFDRTMGGLPAALYAASLEEVSDRFRGGSFIHPVEFDDEGVSFLGDSIRSRGWSERTRLACDCMRAAYEADDAGYEAQGTNLIAFAYGLLPKTEDLPERGIVRELLVVFEDVLYQYADGKYAESDEFDLKTLKTLGEHLQSLLEAPAA